MIYEVKIKFINQYMTDIIGTFNSAYINEESEYLMLFQDISNKGDIANKTLRIAIPLSDIDTVEIKPVYEDNRQTLPRC